MTLPLLGSPLRVGPLILRDRVVAAPMERNYAGRVTDPAVSGFQPVAPAPALEESGSASEAIRSGAAVSF